MRSIKRFLLHKDSKRVIGVDASTKTIAMAMVEDGHPVRMFLIPLPNGDIMTRLRSVRKRFRTVISNYRPDFCLIEAPIMVQNPQTTKHIAYVVGVIMAQCLEEGIDVSDVPPMTWKSFIGYRPIDKHTKEEMEASLGAAEAKKEISRLRKRRVQDILQCRYPGLARELENNDIADALGIALYAWDLRGDDGNKGQ